MSDKKKSRTKLEPLKITCTSSDCNNDLHCFKKSREMAEEDKGKCRSCGTNLIEWERIHQRSLNDVDFTFQSLKHELIRHHYWHIDIDQQAINHARRKGEKGIRERARIEINKKVGSANPYRDGYQTPTKGNMIFYAQHAVACCCRKCIEYWHDIPKGIELTEEQLEYFVELTMLYINERLPDLAKNGEKVPPIRTKKS